MKKVFGIAALLLALAACNKIESENGPVENIVGIPFSATVSLGDNAATKALAESGSTIVATWAEGEKVALIHNGVSDEMTVSSVSGGSATITGTITSPADGEDVTIIYPSSSADGTTGNIKADLLYAQNGLLTGAGSISENYDARKGSGKLKVDGSATLDGSVSLTNQFAIFKFTVKNADASATIDVKPLIITIGTQDYVITPASATSTLYVALPAVSSQTVSFSATSSDSKTYTCSKDGVTFAAAKYYQSTLKMVAAEPEGLAAPLTVEALTAGTVKVNIIKGTLSTGMKYSVNGGAKTLITTSTDIPVSAGDKVRFYGNGTATQVYGDSPEVKILGDGAGFTCKAYGNIMSLLDEENFATKTDLPNQNYVFYGLFYGNTALTDASTLLLPATTLAYSCYNSMFRDCKALTAAPALPATTLAENCYYQMFNGCSVLTAAPALPATTLFTSCYYEMFNGCSALTAAPALPATTLVKTCYDRMFNGCSNLSSVTCLATEGINQNNSTYDWLDGVAASGTFTAATDAIWPEGVNGIPSGWTRKNPDGSAYRPLAEATADDKGKIAGADGQIYDKKADATAAGTTAVAMIIYVGSETDNTTYTHGLALALADESNANMSWSTAKSTCEGKNTSLAVTGGTWMLPSRNQWDTMISAAGSYTALRDGFSSVGGTNLREVGYWSSTKFSTISTDNVWAYYFSSGKWFGNNDLDDWDFVRACLAF